MIGVSVLFLHVQTKGQCENVFRCLKFKAEWSERNSELGEEHECINLGAYPEMHLIVFIWFFLSTCSGHFGVHHLCSQTGDEFLIYSPGLLTSESSVEAVGGRLGSNDSCGVDFSLPSGIFN